MNQRTHRNRLARRLAGYAAAACVGGPMLLPLPGCSRNRPPASVTDAGGRTWMAGGGANKPVQRDEFERSGDSPVNADTFFAAGQLAETQDAGPKAEEAYKKALALDPKHQGALFRMGVLYSKEKKYGEAIEAWKSYVKATNGDAAGYANLGFCYELAGRSEDAEAAYLAGVRKDPMNAPCRVNYGLMLARHGRFNEAVLEMQQVLSEAEVHYNLAAVYEGMGRKEQAKVEYKKALAADPQMTDAQAKLDAIP
jgi:tetratricopeptide (TPR) repeat protein